MNAHVGDRLLPEGREDCRGALIIGLQHADGSPPYVVRWLADGHVAMVVPGPYARIVPADAGQANGKP
jgi:Domain of unknown function (DUF1918)